MSRPQLSLAFADAFNRRDLAAMRRIATDDIEVIPIRAAVEDIVYRGKEGLGSLIRDVDETWSEFEIVIERVEEPTPGTQVGFGRVVARGHESAAPVEMEVRWDLDLVDGRVQRVEAVLGR